MSRPSGFFGSIPFTAISITRSGRDSIMRSKLVSLRLPM